MKDMKEKRGEYITFIFCTTNYNNLYYLTSIQVVPVLVYAATDLARVGRIIYHVEMNVVVHLLNVRIGAKHLIYVDSSHYRHQRFVQQSIIMQTAKNVNQNYHQIMIIITAIMIIRNNLQVMLYGLYPPQ